MTPYPQSIEKPDYAVDQAHGRASDFGINGELNFGVNATQKKIIKLLIESPRITMPAIAEALGITKRNVEINISHLKKAGLVEREGSKKAGRWIVKSGEKVALLVVE